MPLETPPNGEGYARITTGKIYSELVSLVRTVDRMDGRLNDILGENVELRKRVRSLELRFYGILAGLVTAITILIAGVPHASAR